MSTRNAFILGSKVKVTSQCRLRLVYISHWAVLSVKAGFCVLRCTVHEILPLLRCTWLSVTLRSHSISVRQ